MKPEEKDLLLKDLCARLPYGVYAQVVDRVGFTHTCELKPEDIQKMWSYKSIKPYLRPMESMTEEEKFELKQEHVKDQQLFAEVIVVLNNTEMRGKVIPHFAADWCDKNMFDYRGLIPKDLALSTDEFDPYKN